MLCKDPHERVEFPHGRVEFCRLRLVLELINLFSISAGMASRSKRAVSKRPREASPEQPRFNRPEHQVRFERLEKLKFGQSRIPDLVTLRTAEWGDMVGDDIEGLLTVGNWQRLLFIQDPAIRTLTLEVLASFEFDRSYRDLSSVSTIQFRAFGRDHHMSMM